MAGRVPGVVYGRGMEPIPIEVDRREFITALNTDAGMNVLLELQLDGNQVLTLARELQRDPVRGTLLHADFVYIDVTKTVEVEVPVNVLGEPAGVKEGGVLEQPLFTVHVTCLPTDVPEHIDVDVSHLNIGDSLRIGDLPKSDKYEVTNDPDTPVVTIAAPISEAELEAMEAAAGQEQEPTDEAEAAEAAEEGEGAEEERTSDETEPSETQGSE
jgi:large subunit ribosomal protein L25